MLASSNIVGWPKRAKGAVGHAVVLWPKSGYGPDSVFTGVVVPSLNVGQGHAVECGRCGGKGLSSKLRRDGYTNTLVCGDCWDPPPVRRRVPRW